MKHNLEVVLQSISINTKITRLGSPHLRESLIVGLNNIHHHFFQKKNFRFPLDTQSICFYNFIIIVLINSAVTRTKMVYRNMDVACVQEQVQIVNNVRVANSIREAIRPELVTKEAVSQFIIYLLFFLL